MVPHVLCSPAAGTMFQLLLVGREGFRVVHDMCKAVQRKTSTCSTLRAKRSRAHEEAGQRRRVGGVTRRSEPHSPSSAPAPDVAGKEAGVRWAPVKANRGLPLLVTPKRKGNPSPLPSSLPLPPSPPRSKWAPTLETVGTVPRNGSSRQIPPCLCFNLDFDGGVSERRCPLVEIVGWSCSAVVLGTVVRSPVTVFASFCSSSAGLPEVSKTAVTEGRHSTTALSLVCGKRSLRLTHCQRELCRHQTLEAIVWIRGHRWSVFSVPSFPLFPLYSVLCSALASLVRSCFVCLFAHFPSQTARGSCWLSESCSLGSDA